MSGITSTFSLEALNCTNQSITRESIETFAGTLPTFTLMELLDGPQVFHGQTPFYNKIDRIFWDGTRAFQYLNPSQMSEIAQATANMMVLKETKAKVVNEALVLEQMSDFALSLLRECGEKGSTVLSPLSIGLVLALLHAGANGETKKQIGQALAKGSSDEDVQEMFVNLSRTFFKKEFSDRNHTNPGASSEQQIEVSLANRMYIRNNFAIESNYLDEIKKNFDALAQTMNFCHSDAVAKTINRFVAETTKGKITELVTKDTINGGTMCVLVNALYFKGKWMDPFESYCTSEADFFAADGSKRKVDIMCKENYEEYVETNEVQVLSLKYADKSFAFNIFLPKKHVGLAAFLARTNGEEMRKLLEKRRSSYVNARIPRMKVETKLELPETLKKLGIVDVFGESTSDLSGISREKPLYVSQVIHKALIEVDEEGTVAAAATAAICCYMGAATPKPTIFVADRPFLYTLSKDNAPLFIGLYQ